jgi:hypothetical protein
MTSLILEKQNTERWYLPTVEIGLPDFLEHTGYIEARKKQCKELKFAHETPRFFYL